MTLMARGVMACAVIAIGAMAWAGAGLAAARIALVIGNAGYYHIERLANPANDAAGLSAQLKKLGFEVTEKADLDRAGLVRAIAEFSQRLVGAEIGLFFYAGHAVQSRGLNFLIPVGANPRIETDLDFEAVDISRVLEAMESPNRASLVFLDACRNNPFRDRFASEAATRGLRATGAGAAGLAKVATQGVGTLIAFATAPGEAALDGTGANSPFSAGLIAHIATPGLDVSQMLRRVRSDVVASTRGAQRPWDNTSLVSDLYLAGAPEVELNTTEAILRLDRYLESHRQELAQAINRFIPENRYALRQHSGNNGNVVFYELDGVHDIRVDRFDDDGVARVIVSYYIRSSKGRVFNLDKPYHLRVENDRIEILRLEPTNW